MQLSNPDSLWNGPVNFIRASTTRGSMDNIAGYLFDNIQLTERWAFNGGVRFDRIQSDFSQVNYATPPPVAPRLVAARFEENSLLSYRAGLASIPSGTPVSTWSAAIRDAFHAAVNGHPYHHVEQ
jgi:catecholate siderophore receptor